MNFKNIKTLDAHYKYPMSYRIGTIYDSDGLVRVYSNGKNEDYSNRGFFYYKIKNKTIENRFRESKKSGNKFRLVTKSQNGVTDHGF